MLLKDLSLIRVKKHFWKIRIRDDELRANRNQAVS